MPEKTRFWGLMALRKAWLIIAITMLAIGIVIGLIRNASSAVPAIYEADIMYETPDCTESFDWYRGKLRRYDFKVLFVAQEGVDADLKQGDH